MIGKLSELQKEKNEQCTQRHELAVERLRTIVTEETVNAAYISYFQDCTLFLLELENTRKKLEDGSWDSLNIRQAMPIKTMPVKNWGRRWDSF